jgi:hypothetical protein
VRHGSEVIDDSTPVEEFSRDDVLDLVPLPKLQLRLPEGNERTSADRAWSIATLRRNRVPGFSRKIVFHRRDTGEICPSDLILGTIPEHNWPEGIGHSFPLVHVKIDNAWKIFEYPPDQTVGGMCEKLGIESVSQNGKILSPALKLATLPEEFDLIGNRGPGRIFQVRVDNHLEFEVHVAGPGFRIRDVKKNLCDRVLHIDLDEIALCGASGGMPDDAEANERQYSVELKKAHLVRRRFKIWHRAKIVPLHFGCLVSVRHVRKFFQESFKLEDVRLSYETVMLADSTALRSYHIPMDSEIVVRAQDAPRNGPPRNPWPQRLLTVSMPNGMEVQLTADDRKVGDLVHYWQARHGPQFSLYGGRVKLPGNTRLCELACDRLLFADRI